LVITNSFCFPEGIVDVSPKPDTRNEEKRLFFLERKNQRTFSFGSEFPAGAWSGKRRKVFLLFSSEKEAPLLSDPLSKP
jgi:hypothetical protein